MTLRIHAIGFDEVQKIPGSKIYSGWHGKTFSAATFFRKMGVYTIISHSKDGDMQNIIFRKFGFKTIRGSTGRGGVKAAIESIEALKRGEKMAFTPDGPRGPSGVVQGGIVLMAKKSGANIVPVGVSADRKWEAPTWDKYMVPKPFAHCFMVFGEPISVPADATEDTLESIRQQLEIQMHGLEHHAAELAKSPDQRS